MSRTNNLHVADKGSLGVAPHSLIFWKWAILTSDSELGGACWLHHRPVSASIGDWERRAPAWSKMRNRSNLPDQICSDSSSRSACSAASEPNAEVVQWIFRVKTYWSYCLWVSLQAGWQVKSCEGPALGSLATSLWGFWAPLSEVGYCLS